MKKIAILAVSLVFSLSFANVKITAPKTFSKEASAKVKNEGPLNRYVFNTSGGTYIVYAYSYSEAHAKVIKMVISTEVGEGSGQGPIY